jgi:hypothetical protein
MQGFPYVEICSHKIYQLTIHVTSFASPVTRNKLGDWMKYEWSNGIVPFWGFTFPRFPLWNYPTKSDSNHAFTKFVSHDPHSFPTRGDWWNDMCLSISCTLGHDGWDKILCSNLITCYVISMNTMSAIRSHIILYHPSIVWLYHPLQMISFPERERCETCWCKYGQMADQWLGSCLILTRHTFWFCRTSWDISWHV